METCNQACGECHAKHEEHSIWRHDVKHVENAIQTMRRIAYGEYHMENEWKPYGGYHKGGS